MANPEEVIPLVAKLFEDIGGRNIDTFRDGGAYCAICTRSGEEYSFSFSFDSTGSHFVLRINNESLLVSHRLYDITSELKKLAKNSRYAIQRSIATRY